MYEKLVKYAAQQLELDIDEITPESTFESLGIDEMMGGMAVGADSATYTQTEVFEQLLDNENLLKEQYSLLSGNWPKEYNEVVLVLNRNNEIAASFLYQLGFLPSQDAFCVARRRET